MCEIHFENEIKQTNEKKMELFAFSLTFDKRYSECITQKRSIYVYNNTYPKKKKNKVEKKYSIWITQWHDEVFFLKAADFYMYGCNKNR